jgi:hypothetical protein
MQLRAIAWAALLAACACSSGYYVDQAEFCRRAPADPSCPAAAGSAGVSGEGGGAAAGDDGGAGSGGGAGAAGAGPCPGDAACAADEGAGSLCVAGACTRPAGDCGKGTLVVVADGRAPSDAALEGACHFRALAPALAGLAPETKRVVVYADEAEAPGPVALRAGLALEGRAADPKRPVALEVAAPVAGAPLVTLAAGASLKGVALDGGGTAKGVAAAAGPVTLAGPLTIKAAAVALELTGDARATVTGGDAAPVLLTANARGAVVDPGAGLTLTGAVVEGTTGGAGVLVEAGTGSLAATTLEKVTFRDNAASNGVTGTGAVEVRRSRQVAVKGCTFEKNVVSVNVNGEGKSLAGSFAGLAIEGSDFTAGLPASGGALFCGSTLGAGATTLSVGVGNTFPGGKACAQLGPATFGCTEGQLVGFDAPGRDLAVQCLLPQTAADDGAAQAPERARAGGVRRVEYYVVVQKSVHYLGSRAFAVRIGR